MVEQVDIRQFTDNEEQETVRLKHLADINPTKSEISDLDPETEVSFVALEDFGTDGEIKNTENRTLDKVYDGYTYFREGDIAIAKITPSFENGKGAICQNLKNGIGFGTTELHILRPREGVNTEFLWYVLRSKPFMSEAETAMRGVAGQQRVPSNFLENYRIDVIEQSQQKYVSELLSQQVSTLQNIRSKKEDLITLLNRKRERYISDVVTSGIKNECELKETGIDFIGQIPVEWEVVRLKFLLERIEQGWSPKCLEVVSDEDQWGVLKAGAVNNGNFHLSENKTLPSQTEPYEKYVVNQGDVLMNRASGSRELLGSAAIIKDQPSKLLLCDKLYRLHTRDNYVVPEFLAYSLQSNSSRYQIKTMISGADGLANNIPQKDLKNLKVVVPPKEEQRSILPTLEREEQNILKCIDDIRESNRTLYEKRQALITAAVTGQIDMSEEKGVIQEHK